MIHNSEESIDKQIEAYEPYMHRILKEYNVIDNYEDLLQELRISMWKVLIDENPETRYIEGGKAKFLTWLHHVFENRLIDIFRSDYKIRLKKINRTRYETKQKTKKSKNTFPKLDIKCLQVFDKCKRIINTVDPIEIMELSEYLFEHTERYKHLKVLKFIKTPKEEKEEKIPFDEQEKMDLVTPKVLSELSYEQLINCLKDGTSPEAIRMQTDIGSFELTLNERDLVIWNLMLESWSQIEIAKIIREKSNKNIVQSTISRRLKELRSKFKKFMREGGI